MGARDQDTRQRTAGDVVQRAVEAFFGDAQQINEAQCGSAGPGAMSAVGESCCWRELLLARVAVGESCWQELLARAVGESCWLETKILPNGLQGKLIRVLLNNL